MRGPCGDAEPGTVFPLDARRAQDRGSLPGRGNAGRVPRSAASRECHRVGGAVRSVSRWARKRTDARSSSVRWAAAVPSALARMVRVGVGEPQWPGRAGAAAVGACRLEERGMGRAGGCRGGAVGHGLVRSRHRAGRRPPFRAGASIMRPIVPRGTAARSGRCALSTARGVPGVRGPGPRLRNSRTTGDPPPLPQRSGVSYRPATVAASAARFEGFSRVGTGGEGGMILSTPVRLTTPRVPDRR